MWNPGFQGTGKLVKPQRSEAWNFHLPGKSWDTNVYNVLMKCTCIYYNDNDDMQSLHFAACSFKPFASLDSICFCTVLSLCFVISQKYIDRITFRSTKKEQTAETGSRNFNWNTSKSYNLFAISFRHSNKKPFFHPIQSPIYILLERYLFRGGYLMTAYATSQLALNDHIWPFLSYLLALEHPWRIIPSSKWLVIMVSKRSPSKLA